MTELLSALVLLHAHVPRNMAAPLFVRPPVIGPYLVSTMTRTPGCKSWGIWGRDIIGADRWCWRYNVIVFHVIYLRGEHGSSRRA